MQWYKAQRRPKGWQVRGEQVQNRERHRKRKANRGSERGVAPLVPATAARDACRSSSVGEMGSSMSQNVTSSSAGCASAALTTRSYATDELVRRLPRKIVPKKVCSAYIT